MGYIASNLAQIFAAALAGLLIGAAYAVLTRAGMGPLRRPAWLLLVVAAEVWLACILAGALILAPSQAGRWVMAIGSAVVIWIGFVLPVLVVSDGFRGLTASMTIGDSVHWLVVMVVQAAVLEAIGLVHP